MPELYLDLDRRLHIQRAHHTLRAALELGGKTLLDGFHLRERDGEEVSWTHVELVEESLRLRGEIGARWRIHAEVSISGSRCPRAQWEIEAAWCGHGPVQSAFDVEWRAHLEDASPFVPGLFYGENRPEGKGAYPRWSPVEEPEDATSSPAWRFRTDRAMTPLAMLRGRSASAAVLTPDRFSHGASGMGFVCSSDATRLSLHFPFIEEPISYAPYRYAAMPDAALFTAQPGETVTFSFEAYGGHTGWRPLVRDAYRDDPAELSPWVPGARAAQLAARGLTDWHYDPNECVLYETAGFDRYFSRGPAQWDRKHMHVGWVSGLPYALALARHGTRMIDPAMAQAGLSVIDKIAAEGISPAGCFYPQWTEEAGWTGGWVSDKTLPPVAQSRTVAEATWALLVALCAIEGWAVGDRLTSWAAAAQSNLDYAVRIQREDGSFGTYYNLETGAVEEWEGSGGLMWIPALTLASRYRSNAGAAFPRAEEYLQAALRAGEYYAGFIRAERLAGAPEDVPYGVTSEDGYNALLAMQHLYEETGDEKWLELAGHAADYALTFRMSYNATFPENTLLGRYDFRSKGGDVASPSNQHLHNYGYVCIPEMLRLWRLTGDDYYFNRARDHVFCFRQFIAREDGDFNARRGMVPEQWYHTDWFQPKGGVLPLAHSWCAGWIVWVEDWLQSWGTLFFNPREEKTYLLESVIIVDENWDGGTVTIHNPWTVDVDIAAVNVLTEDRTTYHLPAGETHVYQLFGTGIPGVK